MLVHSNGWLVVLSFVQYVALRMCNMGQRLTLGCMLTENDVFQTPKNIFSASPQNNK